MTLRPRGRANIRSGHNFVESAVNYMVREYTNHTKPYSIRGRLTYERHGAGRLRPIQSNWCVGSICTVAKTQH